MQTCTCTLIALFWRCSSLHKFSRRLRVRIALLCSPVSCSFSLCSTLHLFSVCFWRTCAKKSYIKSQKICWKILSTSYKVCLITWKDCIKIFWHPERLVFHFDKIVLKYGTEQVFSKQVRKKAKKIINYIYFKVFSPLFKEKNSITLS